MVVGLSIARIKIFLVIKVICVQIITKLQGTEVKIKFNWNQKGVQVLYNLFKICTTVPIFSSVAKLGRFIFSSQQNRDGSYKIRHIFFVLLETVLRIHIFLLKMYLQYKHRTYIAPGILPKPRHNFEHIKLKNSKSM